MKKVIEKTHNRLDKAALKMWLLMRRSKQIIGSCKGEGFIDNAVSILIAVVIGALLLAGLYKLFGETVLPTLTRRITEMFDYKG